MKATEQFFPVVLVITLYKVGLTLDDPKVLIIQMKATEQFFPVVLFITLYKVDLTVVEILQFDYSNESY